MVTERSAGAPGMDPFELGPFTVHLDRLKLSGRSPRRVLARAVLVALVAWVPTVVLAIVQGVALTANPRESMLLEIRVHVVFLLALPLLVFAETSVLRRLAANARHFWESGLIPRERQA